MDVERCGVLYARSLTARRQAYSCVDELAVVVVARPEATQTLRIEQVDGRWRLHLLEHHLGERGSLVYPEAIYDESYLLEINK